MSLASIAATSHCQIQLDSTTLLCSKCSGVWMISVSTMSSSPSTLCVGSIVWIFSSSRYKCYKGHCGVKVVLLEGSTILLRWNDSLVQCQGSWLQYYISYWWWFGIIFASVMAVWLMQLQQILISPCCPKLVWHWVKKLQVPAEIWLGIHQACSEVDIHTKNVMVSKVPLNPWQRGKSEVRNWWLLLFLLQE